MYNEVDLIIPISSINLTRLQKKLLFNDKAIYVKSTANFKDQALKIKNEIVYYENKTKIVLLILKIRLILLKN